jgi:hypothetical protein
MKSACSVTTTTIHRHAMYPHAMRQTKTATAFATPSRGS